MSLLISQDNMTSYEVITWRSLYTGHVDVRMISKTGGEIYDLYKWSKFTLFTDGYFVYAKTAEK